MRRTSEAVSQTVILAAGLGARLSGSEGIPKPLLHVAGLPLVAHALAHAAASGCSEAVIVVGHESERVRAAVETITATAPPILRLGITFVENPDFTTPNGQSLLATERVVHDRFFLQMVDHLFAEPVLRRLASAPLDARTSARVLIDRAPVNLDLSDATKVRLDGDRVVAIGKAVDPWDAIDAGCFLLTPAVFDALRRVPPLEPCTVSSAMRQLIERRAVAAEELAGVRWMDVDTPADRAEAERLLATSQAGIVSGV